MSDNSRAERNGLMLAQESSDRSACVHRLRLAGPMPLIAVSGSRGKSTVATMLDTIFQAARHATALWISSGVYYLGDKLEGELGPWQRVLFAAQHEEIDVVIQEMHASMVVAVGLPVEIYSLVIATTICGNNDACLISDDARIECQSLESVLRSVRSDGLIIAGVDDFDVAEATEQTGVERALFALRKENPILERHLFGGGLGAWVDQDQIVVGSKNSKSSLMYVSEAPATLDGTLAFQIQNVLAAALSAHVLGVSRDAIVVGLKNFSPHPHVQPAACNIIDYNGARVVIDAPTQVWSLRMLMRGVRNLPRRRTMIVSGVFPALPLEDVKEAGRLLGTLGAILVLHASDESAERMKALRAGIASAPLLPLVLQVTDELQAIDLMLNKIGIGDVALVLASDPVRALEHLWPAPVISMQRPSAIENGVVGA